MSTALPAAADQPSEYPPACDTSKVSRSDVDRAHTVFLSGKQYLEESNYDKAIGYFKDAYAIDCSMHAILPIIATAFERKGDKGEAVRALAEYVDRAPSAPDHDVIERRIKNLKDQLARDQPPPPPPPPPPAPAIPAAPTAPTTLDVTVAAAPTSPPRSAPAASRPSALPWVTVGVGAATFATGLVVYAVGAGDVSSAEKKCGGDHASCPVLSAIDEGNNGRKLEQIGGPVIGVGLVIAAAGAIWHFLAKQETSTTGPAAGIEVTPVVAHGYAGVGIRSAF